MSYDIGPRIGIEGEKAFRDAIKEINSNIRTLGTEMKVATSEYAKNDKSAEALTAKNVVLNKQIEEQKNKLNVATQAMEASTKEHGASAEATQKWQRQVNDATAKINIMERELKNNTKAIEAAEKPTEETAKDVKEFGNNAEEAGKKSLTMGDIIKANLISDAIIGGIKALGSAMAGLAGKAKESAREAAAYADDMLTLSDTTGIATDTLQELKYMEELVDVSLDDITKTMSRNVRAMDNANRGSKQYVEAYEKLGVTVTNTDGTLRDNVEVYWEMIDALGEMENQTEADAVAMTLFGRSARDLVPITNIGSEGIKEFAQEARAMGAVMSEEALGSLGEYDDALQRLDQSQQILTRTFGSIFAPMLQEVATATTGYLTNLSLGLQEADGDTQKMGEAFGNTLSTMLSDLISTAPELITGARAMMESFVGGILEQLPEIINLGLELIKSIAFGLLENLPMIIETALQVVISLAHGIAESLPELIPVLVDTVLTIVDTLIENLPLLLEAALAIIIALAEGLMESLPTLLEKLPELVTSIVDALIESAPMLIDASIELIGALMEGFFSDPFLISRTVGDIIFALIDGLVRWNVELFQKGKDLVKQIIKGLTSGNFKDVGKNMIEGLINGMLDMGNWVKDKIGGIGKSITDGFKKVFGIKSPSKLFEDEIGANLAFGLGEGFEDNMKKVTRDMQRAVPTEFDTAVSYTGSTISSGNIFDYEKFALILKAVFRELNLSVVMDESELGRVVNNVVAKEVFA